MTVDLLPLLLHGVPAGAVLSGAWAVLGWLVDALVWLLEHGLLVALATGAAAYIAWQAHRRERLRMRKEQAANDARIEALAFAVHRELSFTTLGLQGEPAEDRESRARTMLDATSSLESKMEDLMVLAPDASEETAERIREAAAGFYQLLAILRLLVAGVGLSRDSGDDTTKPMTPPWLWDQATQQKKLALENLREASSGLQRIVIDRVKESAGRESE